MSGAELSLSGQIGYMVGTLCAWYFQGTVGDKEMWRLIEGLEGEGYKTEQGTLGGVKRHIQKKNEYRQTRVRVASFDDSWV